METRFGADFRDVRVHTDQSAAASADALEANAYTTGRDIYFGAGKYAPASQDGQHLLAHELTHVQQQAAGQTPLEAEGATDEQVLIGSPTDRLESEADKQADSVTSGDQVTESVTPDSSGAIQRDGWNSFGDNPITNTVTSGARQGADLVTSGARQGVDLVVSGAQQGAAFVVAQIEKLAPGALAFFRNIRDYFKNAISKGVDGLFGGIISKIREKGLAATLAEMIGSFASGAFQAVSGFVAGQCAAIGKLAEYLIDLHIRIGSGILDQVKKGFDAIRGPLEELWSEYGATAIVWIKTKLKGMWQGVEDTASTIWEALKPLRKGAAWIWNQVTDLLVEGRRGFNDWLEWFIPKAIDEWEKIKTKIKPYMGYVKTAAKIIVAVVLLFSPAGPFIAAGLAIYGLYLGVKELWEKWGRGFTKDVRAWFANKALPWVQSQLQGLRDKVNSIKNTVVSVIGVLYDALMQVLDALGVITFLESVKSVFDSVAKKVREFKEKLDQKLDQWSEKLQALMTKADPYLQQLKEAFRQSLLIVAFGPYSFLDDGVWNSINKFVALLMRTPCLREVGGLLRFPGFMQRLGRLRSGIKEGWEVIKNPDPLLAKMKEAVAPMVGKIEPEVHQRVSTIGSSGAAPTPSTAGSPAPGATGAAAAPATSAITNATRAPATPSPTRTPAEIEAEKERSEYDERRRQAAAMSATGPMTEREIFIQLSVWHYLSASLVHLASNWWEELKKIGGDLLWPWPAVAKDFMPMIEDFSNAVSVAFDLEFSDAIDKFLAGMRKFNGIAGALSGWMLIALVLIGAGLGALGFAFGPLGGATVGAGAATGLAVAEEIGIGLLVIALATEAAVLEKAQFDLLYQNPRMAEDKRYTADQEDAKAIAGSLMSVITIGALFLLADIAARFAKFFWSLIEDIPIVRDITSILRDAKKAAGDFSLREKPGAVEPPREGGGAPRDVSGEPTRPREPGERPVEPGERPVEPTERPAERPSERLPEDAAAKAEKQGVPRERLEAEVGELNRRANNPENVRRPSDKRFDAEMNTEVNAERHTFDRDKADRSWCRFTKPDCGLDLGGDLNAKVDTALEAKPAEAPRVEGPEGPAPETPTEVPKVEDRPGEVVAPDEPLAPGEPVTGEPGAVREAPPPEPAPATEARPVEPADVLPPDQVRRYDRYARTQRSKGREPKGPKEWYDQIGQKPPPNPHGKRGDPASEAAIERLAEKARAEYPNDIVHQGTSIEKKTGVNREPDVWVENAETGAVEKVYEAAKTNQDGTFVPRERVKKVEYDAAGIPNEFLDSGPFRKRGKK